MVLQDERPGAAVLSAVHGNSGHLDERFVFCIDETEVIPGDVRIIWHVTSFRLPGACAYPIANLSVYGGRLTEDATLRLAELLYLRDVTEW